MADNRFRTREIAVGKGRLRTADDPATIGPEDVSTAKNVRPSEQYLRGVGGMTKINTSALSSTGIRNGFHFRKAQPAESHVLAWTTDGKVWKNDTAVPSAGAFTGTAVFTDTAGGTTGRFAPGPNGSLVYANGKEACLWGGTEHRCAAFIDYPTTGQIYDYSDLVTNTKTDAQNLATIHTVASVGADSDTSLLLHFDADFTDSSPASPHTVTANGNAAVSSVATKFGAKSCLFDGTGDYLTVSYTAGADADFDFSGGLFTIDFWFKPTSLTNGQVVYKHATDANNYMEISIYKGASTWGMRLKVVAASVVVVNTSLLNPSDLANTDTGWHHWAFVDDGDNWYKFVDGAVRSTVSGETNRCVEYTGTPYIGSDTSGSNAIAGYLDEFRVSKVARWTASFSVPAVAYASSSYSSVSYIGSIMPLDGVKFTVATANPLSSGTATMSMSEWNGTSWSSLTITDNTAVSSRALEQTGTVTWATTATTSKPTQVEKMYLYWYKMVISSASDFGGITLSNVTVSIPFQAIKDVWDGSERPANAVLGYKSSVYYDYTSNVLENGYSATGSTADDSTFMKLGGYTSSDYVYVGCIERLSGLIFNIVDAKANALASVMSVSYWDGTAWVALSIQDGTANGTATLGQSGWVTWPALDRTSEFKRSNFGSASSTAGRRFTNSPFPTATVEPEAGGTTYRQTNSLYYYRVGFSGTLTDPTNVYHVAGIPVPRDIRGYSFPMLHQNRAVLLDNADGARNTILMSAQDTANVFNGLDAYEFPIGRDETINSAASLFLRYGSSVQDLLLIGKIGEMWVLEGNGSDNDPYRVRMLSEKVGVLAPLTMTTVPVGDLGGGARRQIAVWESQRGIEVFDGVSLMDPLLSYDIRDKFDPLHANYAGGSTNVGFYDPVYDEYHWCPVGAAEWVYSFKYKKWFQIDRGTGNYLYGGIPVLDTSGNSYVYGFDNAGYTYRLENGTDFSGTAIAHTIKTGSIALNENRISEETSLRMVKIVQVAKNTTSNTMTVTHYGDTATSGNTVGSAFSPAASGRRLCTKILNAGSKGPHVHHEFQLALTTNDETCGCEPIYIVAYYDGERQDVR